MELTCTLYNLPVNLVSTQPAEVGVATPTDHVVAASILLYHGLTGGTRLHIVM